MKHDAGPTSNKGNLWAHLALLLGTLLFAIPFVYMLGTSLKVDEELPDNAILPRIPTYRASSPYVRDVASIAAPGDAPSKVWDAEKDRLIDHALQAVRKLSRTGADAAVDQEKLNASVSRQLTQDLSARIPTEFWKQNDAAKIESSFDKMLSDEGTVRGAIDDRVGRFEIRRIQFRAIDEQPFSPYTTSSWVSHALKSVPPWTLTTVIDGAALAAAIKIESPSAQVIAGSDCAVIKYDFGAADAPVTIRYDFPMPTAFDEFHKLIVAIRADDSWHAVDATLDVDGVTWRSQRTTPLAQNRAMSITFQPPGFEDQTSKPRTWVPIAPEHPLTRVAPAHSVVTFRLIVSPRNTAQAIGAKALRNYRNAFDAVPFWSYTANSILLVALSMGGALFSSSFVAYAFARLNWPGRSVGFLLVLATMMLPGQVTMIPSFMIWRALGWYNTLNPLWVGAWFGNAFFIFLMTQHMRTIPRELEEAARIDGLNALETWYYIILPQVKPTLAAIAVLTFMGAWNEFMGPLIYLRDQDKFPLSLGLFGMRVDQVGGRIDWGVMMAGAMLMTLPVIVVFFFCQRYFIRGVTLTGMKG